MAPGSPAGNLWLSRHSVGRSPGWLRLLPSSALSRPESWPTQESDIHRRWAGKPGRSRGAQRPLVRCFDGIAVEDLAVPNMIKHHSLAKSFRATGWGEFPAMLTFMAQRCGRTLAVVDRCYPRAGPFRPGHLLASLSLPCPRYW